MLLLHALRLSQGEFLFLSGCLHPVVREESDLSLIGAIILFFFLLLVQGGGQIESQQGVLHRGLREKPQARSDIRQLGQMHLPLNNLHEGYIEVQGSGGLRD